MEIPETRYAKSGDVSIAYQVVGEGPFDVVLVPGHVSHVELAWENPVVGPVLRRLASFARVITFDKRGTGMSDRAAGIPPLETRMDDLRAVMDAAGSPRAAVFGTSEGAPMSLLFAATYPERVSALVLRGGFARLTWAPDYPWGLTEEEFRRESEDDLKLFGPRDEAVAALVKYLGEEAAPLVDYFRQSASPAVIKALAAMNEEIDVRDALPLIQAPTLIVHGTEDHLRIEGARYMADQIPGARLVEIEGMRHTPFGKDRERVLDEIEQFLLSVCTGATEEQEPDRVLATVLFTDIVGSTAKAAELGDSSWHELLTQHHELTRRELARFRGREIDTAGDGFFASFDGPARAIRCARSIAEQVRRLGIEIRAGLHTGECELMDGKVAGIAVSIGARVASHAGPSEVLVSQTVKDLVAGSGLTFEDRGAANLKGVPGEWRLFAVQGG